MTSHWRRMAPSRRGAGRIARGGAPGLVPEFQADGEALAALGHGEVAVDQLHLFRHIAPMTRSTGIQMQEPWIFPPSF